MPHLSLRTRPARAARLARTLFVCCLLASFVLTPAAPVVAAAPDVAVPYAAAAGMAGAALARAGAPAGNTAQVGEPPLVPDSNWQVEPPDLATAPPPHRCGTWARPRRKCHPWCLPPCCWT